MPYLSSLITWSDDDLAAARIPIVDRPVVTVGGGLGSLAVVQALRVAGMSTDEIAILGPSIAPHAAFRCRAEASQLGLADPLRSGSDATMDNLWGFPGYALRRALRERTFRPLWQVFAEPVLGEYFTPHCEELYAGIEREARRLGWEHMLDQGYVQCIRRRAGGGYFVLHRREGTAGTVAYRCRYVHLAVGTAGPRLLPTLDSYRRRFPTCDRVVQSYEVHEQVYARLRSASGTVVLRGAGITASRVLQRLIEDRRASEQDTRIVHLLRTPVDGPRGPWRFRRDGGDGFSYQAFNFPKAAFGGQLKAALANLDESARTALIAEMGGASTPRRKRWTAQIRDGLQKGWYRQIAGEVSAIDKTEDGRLALEVRQRDGNTLCLLAEALIDATGLEGRVAGNLLLRDLIQFSGARTNLLGGLAVTPNFEVEGTRHVPGRLYASGLIAAGGAYGPVDSFLGLQYAALAIAGDLGSLGACRRLTPARSVRQWWRWVRNRAP